MCNKHFRIYLLLALSVLLMAGLIFNAQAAGGQVSGTVYIDKNADGSFTSGERTLLYVDVTLYRQLSSGEWDFIASTSTTKNGIYAFSVPDDGTYRLHFEAPDNYRYTYFGQGSQVLPAKENISDTLPFTLSDGKNITLDAGLLTGNSYVSIVAFEDSNANGGRKNNEPLIRYVKVGLYFTHEGVDYLVAETITDKEGQASFSYVSPGPYHIKATLPENYVSGPMGTKINSFYNYMMPSITNECESPTFEVPEKSGIAMGIGMVKTGSLSGSIWQDANGNDAKDSNENGCPGAKVFLSSDALNITRTTDIDVNGQYHFTGLQPAEYSLTIELPESMIFSDSASSYIKNIAGSASTNVSVQVEQNTLVPPIGAAKASVVEVYVHDAGRNAPLSGVSANLVQNGTLISSALSDQSGMLRFPLVRCGEGQISFTLPKGYLVAQDGGVFPYENGKEKGTFTVQVPLNDNVRLEAAAIETISISGRIAEDPTNTGTILDTNVSLSGFTVQAIDANGAVAHQTVSDENGMYTVSALVPGSYTIRFLLDDRYIATPYLANESSAFNSIYTQQPEYGETQVISLTAGEKKDQVNAAFFKAGIADGYVLLNPNYDQLASNHGGLSGVKVTLLHADGTAYRDYAYSITDENGYFCIKGILPGEYTLHYQLPGGCAFVAPLLQEKSYVSPVFTVSNGSQIHASPIGAVRTAILSGSVLDYSTESGISATITLQNSRTGEVFTLQTDAIGSFAFSDMLPDTYLMQVSLADGFVFADSEKSVLPYLNASSTTAQVTLPMGGVQENCDIIASQPVDWQVQLYYDKNNNLALDDKEDMVVGRQVDLYLREDYIGSFTTDQNGLVSFNQIISATYTLRIPLLDREVLLGKYNDSCTIHSSYTLLPLMQYGAIEGSIWSLDGTMNGVSGITVSLLKDGNVQATEQTGANGHFRFENLLEGQYQLRCTPAAGYLFARAVDAVERDSYILSKNDGSLMYGIVDLAMGEVFSRAHIGIGGMGTIGDTAWIDLDKNGMLDIDEPLLPGVEIQLYQYGELITSAKTDVYGRYTLTNLYPGVYEMHVSFPKEVKPTIRQTQFPLVASILPENARDNTVVVENVVVPSMDRNLNVDMGFVLKKKNVYPASLNLTPSIDWTEKNQIEE